MHAWMVDPSALQASSLQMARGAMSALCSSTKFSPIPLQGRGDAHPCELRLQLVTWQGGREAPLRGAAGHVRHGRAREAR